MIRLPIEATLDPMKPSLIVLLLASSCAFAADPTQPTTQTCLPDKLIAAEAFDKPESFTKQKQPGTDGWRGGIGTWSIKDGAAYAVQEAPSDKRPNGHEAVCEHIVDLGDYVLTGEFKLGPSPQIGFVCRDTNQPNLHQGRVMITPTAIWIQKMSGIAKETRREELKKIEVQLDPNTWHRITIEIVGDHFFAKIDDHVLEATHERFKERKGRVGFVARAEGAQFRNIALWSAKAK
jgi:hypothetical protein